MWSYAGRVGELGENNVTRFNYGVVSFLPRVGKESLYTLYDLGSGLINQDKK